MQLKFLDKGIKNIHKNKVHHHSLLCTIYLADDLPKGPEPYLFDHC